MKIVYLRNQQTLQYAAEELAKYWEMMTDEKPAVAFSETVDADAINIGLLSDLGRPDEDVQDAVLEDVLDVSIVEGKGFVAGSNPRSALMGVYRFLRFAGCRFIRPGKGGEIQLTDAMAIMAREKSMIAYEFEGTRHDMGSKLGFLKANVSLGVKSEELGEEFSQWLKEFVKTL